MVHPILDPNNSARVPANLCAFGIMTKAPHAGKVKTRLTPPLTPVEAAELNKCFLRDLGRSISKAAGQSPGRGVGIFTPAGSEVTYENILPAEFSLIPQRGETFGERLLFAIEDLLKVGFASVCLINSDSPTVPTASFARAATVLAQPDDRVVLGPSEDGGYFLIGLKQPHARLFQDIEWSTDRVLGQTLKRIAEIGLPVEQLPIGRDIDNRASLHHLCHELLGENAGSTTDAAPHTRKFLADIVAREGRDRIWPR